MPTIDEIMRLIVPTTDSTVAEVRAAIESAIAAAVAAEREPLTDERREEDLRAKGPAHYDRNQWVVTGAALSRLFQSLDRVDTAQPGFHWARGWNDALRYAMDCLQSPVPPQAVQLTEDQIKAEFQRTYFGTTSFPNPATQFLRGVRFAELAHNITGQKE